MPGLPNELRIIFAEEFRRQVRNKGFMFFTALIVVVMIAAIPVTGFVVGLFEDAQEEAVEEAIGAMGAPDEGGIESTFGYVDPAGILPGAAKDESRIREFEQQRRRHRVRSVAARSTPSSCCRPTTSRRVGSRTTGRPATGARYGTTTYQCRSGISGHFSKTR